MIRNVIDADVRRMVLDGCALVDFVRSLSLNNREDSKEAIIQIQEGTSQTRNQGIKLKLQPALMSLQKR